MPRRCSSSSLGVNMNWTVQCVEYYLYRGVSRTNAYEFMQQSGRVSRDPVPMIISFTCEPITVIAGEQATLRWTTRDTEAASVAIDPEIGAVGSSGSLEITPLKTTTYALRLTCSGLEDTTKAVTVTVSSSPQSDEKPSARVRRASGRWKHGKGFSYGELEAAGLATAEAARRSIPIDRRRRSTHRENVETIRRSIDA